MKDSLEEVSTDQASKYRVAYVPGTRTVGSLPFEPIV